MNSQVLLSKAGIECDIDKEITQIVRYGQMADEHSLYVDVYDDSECFVQQALRQGALVISEKKISGCITVANARRVLSELVQIFYDFPHQKMKLIGVTGTCGKSTVVHLIHSCFKNQGIKSCCVMSGKVIMDEQIIMTRNTTPDALFLIPLMRKCLDEGIDTLMMEVSSEAFIQWRTEGLYFDIIIGTNIASDHLDTHKTLHHYRETKKRILSLVKPCGVVILNNDDELFRFWKHDLPGYKLTYGLKQADFLISDVRLSLDKTVFMFSEWEIETKLLAMANVYNVAACLCCAFVLDLNMDKVVRWASQVQGCPGRFEVISKTPYVMVDYAHTESAMENVLSFLKSVTDKKIICVFGCGGHRDTTKRPLMGKTAVKYCDCVIVTSDNPRDESPEKIIEEILLGCTKEVMVEVDRIKAIELALALCTKDDIIVLIGKGDESSLFSNGEMIPCTDAQIVKRYLKEDSLWGMHFLY